MVTHVNGFVPVAAAFYCVFDPTQGSKVMCQVPDGAVIPTGTSQVPHKLISFDLVKNYLIPKPPLCNKQVSFRAGKYVVVGHPVNIVSECYERNSFTYNFVFIFQTMENSEPYQSAITRLAKMTKALEEQSRYLSNPDNLYEIDSVLEQMFQDLNNFSECQIPFDQSNKVNIKLFPILEGPPDVKSFHVPIATVRLDSLIDEMWDPTMERIIPYINGINSVKRIADLAEADYDLTKQCIQHFLHYDCVVIIGIFQFSNVYALTPAIAKIATDKAMYEELCAFVLQPRAKVARGYTASDTPSTGGHTSVEVGTTPASHISSLDGRSSRLTQAQVFHLFSSFHSGLSVYTWYDENRPLLQDVDVRRFLVFGVMKGLVCRVHSFPVYDAKQPGGGGSYYLAAPSDVEIRDALKLAELPDTGNSVELIRSCCALEPMHFDELCTELRASRIKLSKLLRSLGEWTVVNR